MRILKSIISHHGMWSVSTKLPLEITTHIKETYSKKCVQCLASMYSLKCMCMTYFERENACLFDRKHNKHVNIKLCTEKNVFSLMIGTMRVLESILSQNGMFSQFLPNVT